MAVPSEKLPQQSSYAPAPPSTSTAESSTLTTYNISDIVPNAVAVRQYIESLPLAGGSEMLPVVQEKLAPEDKSPDYTIVVSY